MIKINLGCGRNIKDGWVNVDKTQLDGVNVVHDLNKMPYPFPDDYADYILMEHVLEHLDDVVSVIEECHRILKPHGKLEIFVPYYKAKNAFTDPTHKHFFTEYSMDYFTDGIKRLSSVGSRFNFYSDARFKVIKLEKYRDGFPFWHIRRYMHFSVKLPLFSDTLHWILEVVK